MDADRCGPLPYIRRTKRRICSWGHADSIDQLVLLRADVISPSPLDFELGLDLFRSNNLKAE